MRLRSPLMLVLVVLLALTGCHGGSSQPRADRHAGSPSCVTADEPHRAVQEVLDRRAAAVREGDLAAFLATVDPGAKKGVRAEEQAWFGRVQALPKHSFDLALDRVASDDGLTTYVTQRVRLDGIDAEPVEVDHVVTFARPGGCWLVATDQPEADEVSGAPWDVAGSHLSREGGVVLVTDIDAARRRGRLLDAAVGAWRDERRLLAPFNRRRDDTGVVVMAFTTPKVMEALGYRKADLELTGAITLPAERRRPGDVRVIVSPSVLGVSAEPALPALFRHEFAHVLLNRYDQAPVWATEGAAELYATATGAPDNEIAALLSAARVVGTGLPTEDFYADTGDRRAGNYAVSWAAMRVLADEHGVREPARLLRALDETRADLFASRVDRVLQERYGMTADELGARARELLDHLRTGP